MGFRSTGVSACPFGPLLFFWIEIADVAGSV